MKKTFFLLFIFFLSFCSMPGSEGVASFSNETTTTLVILKEDYPIVLTRCLNEEMDYNIATPFDNQDLKTTISHLSNSKDEELQLREDVNYCINKYNLWSDSSSLNQDDLAALYDVNLELARCLRENGINVPDPSQQEPKINLNEFKNSKDDVIPLLEECGYGKEKNEK